MLFKHNFGSHNQMTKLSTTIHTTTPHPILIYMNQEDEHVQRFHKKFNTLAPLQNFETQYTQTPEATLTTTHAHTQLMTNKIHANSINLNFAPVMNLSRDNRAIDDRAFNNNPQIVTTFTRTYIQTLHSASIATTLKHFPDHNTVLKNTHIDHASNPRPLKALQAENLVPFVAGIETGADTVMMAHMIYPQIAPEPARYSQH